MAKSKAGLSAPGRYRDEKHGFSLPRLNHFDYEPAKSPIKPATPLVTVGIAAKKLELVVLSGAPLSPQMQEAATEKLAASAAKALRDGRASGTKPVVRPDKRASFRAAYAGKKHRGFVVSVAGERRTFLVVSAFPTSEPTPEVEDLVFIQLSLAVEATAPKRPRSR